MVPLEGPSFVPAHPKGLEPLLPGPRSKSGRRGDLP